MNSYLINVQTHHYKLKNVLITNTKHWKYAFLLRYPIMINIMIQIKNNDRERRNDYHMISSVF